jgi:hypothetical protein
MLLQALRPGLSRPLRQLFADLECPSSVLLRETTSRLCFTYSLFDEPKTKNMQLASFGSLARFPSDQCG